MCYVVLRIWISAKWLYRNIPSFVLRPRHADTMNEIWPIGRFCQHLGTLVLGC
jgi:hypothetical protein